MIDKYATSILFIFTGIFLLLIIFITTIRIKGTYKRLMTIIKKRAEYHELKKISCEYKIEIEKQRDQIEKIRNESEELLKKLNLKMDLLEKMKNKNS
jgi:hypothetical protein